MITAGHQYDHPSEDSLRRMGVAGIAADHILRTDEGDSTPEVSGDRDVRADDNLIFETDGTTINRILRVQGP